MPKPVPSYLGEGIMFIPPGTSTTARVHELAHKRLGHEPGRMPVSEFVSRELDAEIYAWKTMDREITPRVGLPALVCLWEDYKFPKREALRLVVKGLREKGIKVTRDSYEDLKDFFLRSEE